MADWVGKMKESVQPHVPEPVVATGMLQPPGTLGNTGLRMLSPLLGWFRDRKANERAGGLTKTSLWAGTKVVLIALTADKAYAFAAKPRGRGWKVGDKLAEWARRDLKVSTDPGRMTTKVNLDVVSTGDHYELEATTIGSGYNDVFLAELART